MIKRALPLLAAAPLALLAACATPGDFTGNVATAQLKDATGRIVGTATATETPTGLAIGVGVSGLPAGTHGAHIHTTGDCSKSDFTSAGGHWNPTNHNHGTMSAQPNPHAGDLPNMFVKSDGTAQLTGMSAGTFAQLMDADGAAFVIHADPDDYKTQPTGNAGARIACGVFAAR